MAVMFHVKTKLERERERDGVDLSHVPSCVCPDIFIFIRNQSIHTHSHWSSKAKFSFFILYRIDRYKGGVSDHLTSPSTQRRGF